MLLMALGVLSGTIAYVGYLVVGGVAEYLQTNRFLASLLLASLLARIPWIRHGGFQTVGLLPKPARRPVTVAILAACAIGYFYRSEIVSMALLACAATLLLMYPSMKRAILGAGFATLFRSQVPKKRSIRYDETVIDVEVRVRKE